MEWTFTGFVSWSFVYFTETEYLGTKGLNISNLSNHWLLGWLSFSLQGELWSYFVIHTSIRLKDQVSLVEYMWKSVKRVLFCQTDMLTQLSSSLFNYDHPSVWRTKKGLLSWLAGSFPVLSISSDRQVRLLTYLLQSDQKGQARTISAIWKMTAGNPRTHYILPILSRSCRMTQKRKTSMRENKKYWCFSSWQSLVWNSWKGLCQQLFKRDCSLQVMWEENEKAKDRSNMHI